jgi:hypothetical protein
MSDKIEQYRARLIKLQSEAGFLSARMHTSRDGLVELIVKSREAVNESRELMKRADAAMALKR